MRRIFRKKEVEFNYLIRRKDMHLSLAEEDSDFSATTVKCRVMSDESLFQLIGGTPPYAVSSLDFEGFDYFSPRLFECGEEKVDITNNLPKDLVDALFLGLPVRNLVELFLSKKKTLELDISVLDAEKRRVIIPLRVHTSVLFEQLKKHFDDKVSVRSARAMPALMKKANVTSEIEFIPLNQMVFSSIDPKMEIEFVFHKGYGIESASYVLSDFMHYSGDLDKVNTAHLRSIEVQVVDPKKLVKLKGKEVAMEIRTKSVLGKKAIQLSLDVSHLKRALINDYFGDYRKWELEDLIATTVISKGDWSKVVERKGIAKAMYGSPLRNTIHFALNHVVESHMYGTWEGKDRIVFIPMKDLVAKNKGTIYGGSTVDFFCVGFVLLPKTMFYLDRHEGESWNDFVARANAEMTNQGYRVMAGGMWAWAGSWDVTNWWNSFAQKHGWVAGAHSSTDFGNTDQYTQAETPPPLDGSKEALLERDRAYRAVWMDAFAESYPALFKKFKKPLLAWKSFWDRKRKY